MNYFWIVLGVWVGFASGYLCGFRRGFRRGSTAFPIQLGTHLVLAMRYRAALNKAKGAENAENL